MDDALDLVRPNPLQDADPSATAKDLNTPLLSRKRVIIGATAILAAVSALGVLALKFSGGADKGGADSKEVAPDRPWEKLLAFRNGNPTRRAQIILEHEKSYAGAVDEAMKEIEADPQAGTRPGALYDHLMTRAYVYEKLGEHLLAIEDIEEARNSGLPFSMVPDAFRALIRNHKAAGNHELAQWFTNSLLSLEKKNAPTKAIPQKKA